MKLLPDPTWLRLGLQSCPDPDSWGKDVGVVVIDYLKPHPTIRHLGKRLQYVTVNDDLAVTCSDIFSKEHEETHPKYEHGLKSLLLLAHKPIDIDGKSYVGLAPAATYVVLNTFRPELLGPGIKWILERKDEWNLRIVLSTAWHTPPQRWVVNTKHKPVVQALAPALEAGLLVVSHNGNTRTINELPPIDYLSVGGYDDQGSSDPRDHRPHPDEPWGRNGDGHLRPDVLAPRMHLPIPYCEAGDEPKRLSYFGGTSGASTMVAGLCAYIASLFPKLDNLIIEHALIEGGHHLTGYENPAPCVHAAHTLGILKQGFAAPLPKSSLPHIHVADPKTSLSSEDDVERALSLSVLEASGLHIDHLSEYPSHDFWRFGEKLDEARSLPGEFLLVATKER